MMTLEEEQALMEIFDEAMFVASFNAWCEAFESEYGSVDAPCL